MYAHNKREMEDEFFPCHFQIQFSICRINNEKTGGVQVQQKKETEEMLLIDSIPKHVFSLTAYGYPSRVFASILRNTRDRVKGESIVYGGFKELVQKILENFSPTTLPLK